MGTVNTYSLTVIVRKKLVCEACRVNQDLRLLVGHANLLDKLLHSADAAEEGEQRCNQIISVTPTVSQDRLLHHNRWVSVAFGDLEKDWIPEEPYDLASDVSESDDAVFDESIENEDNTDSKFKLNDVGALEKLSKVRSSSHILSSEQQVPWEGLSKGEGMSPSPLHATKKFLNRKDLDREVIRCLQTPANAISSS